MPAKHEPTAATRGAVESMTAYGIPQDEIARSIGITANTLRKHYREEIETAVTKANARVAQTLFKMATDISHKSCAASAMFWAKTRMGWRETTHVDHSNTDGTMTPKLDVTKLSTEALAEIVAASNGATDT